MKIEEEIIQRIEVEVGHKLRSAADCTRFALDIESMTGEPICANTIKRAFGVIDASSGPSAFTLNLIARRLGYSDWEAFINCRHTKTSSFNCKKIISLKDVAPNTIVSFSYSPNRIVKMKSLGDCNFVITESRNSKLQGGDVVTAYQIAKGQPFELISVVRAGQPMGAFTAGMHDGITDFNLTENYE